MLFGQEVRVDSDNWIDFDVHDDSFGCAGCGSWFVVRYTLTALLLLSRFSGFAGEDDEVGIAVQLGHLDSPECAGCSGDEGCSAQFIR